MSSCISPTITPAAAVTGLANMANATKIMSRLQRCGAISAGLLVVFHTINTPNVTNARNNGPTNTIVRNCDPVSVVLVFASSSTIFCRASSSSFSKDFSVIFYDLLTSAPSSPTSVRSEHGGLHEPAIVYPLPLPSWPRRIE